MIPLLNILLSALTAYELFKVPKDEEGMIESAKKLAFLVPAQLIFNILALTITNLA